MQADKKLDKTHNKIRNRSYTELALSLILTLFKLLAGILGNSTLLLADAVRSFSEFIDECIKLLDFSIGSKPGDESHNYGHGKITTLCMGAGAFILLFASFHMISLNSGEILMFLQGKEPETPEIIALYAATSAFILRNIVAVLTENPELQTKEDFSKARIPVKDVSIISVKRLLIIPIKEVLISCFVILGIGCTFLPGKNFNIADSFAALLLSLYLLGNSGRLLYKIVNELIEASLDEENNLRIKEIINKTENVTGSGELKTRRIGKGIAINAIVNVNNSLSVLEAAEIANLVEERLKAAFTENTYVLIKIEPVPERNQNFKNRGRSSNEKKGEKASLF
ncbi:cation transporter [Methanosarcina sp. A14]|uniref:Cation efflux system protein n=2 Tax=Methanosarcina barkeri TaxID=2208 RepID=A0A0E3LPD3_METBA|nr:MULTISPECIES: cation diffusion facilitator family transporter [Methanosarcina]AKB56321.1 Cation efflux system protein [Methanosarcina barkeri MS]AKJ40444.1 cation diffusion facilitator family transporter [Methanosarcina barkeri CM1]OED03291.1 cation transporter [Methanosarcina sp. A14]